MSATDHVQKFTHWIVTHNEGQVASNNLRGYYSQNPDFREWKTTSWERICEDHPTFLQFKNGILSAVNPDDSAFPQPFDHVQCYTKRFLFPFGQSSDRSVKEKSCYLVYQNAPKDYATTSLCEALVSWGVATPQETKRCSQETSSRFDSGWLQFETVAQATEAIFLAQSHVLQSDDQSFHLKVRQVPLFYFNISNLVACCDMC